MRDILFIGSVILNIALAVKLGTILKNTLRSSKKFSQLTATIHLLMWVLLVQTAFVCLLLLRQISLVYLTKVPNATSLITTGITTSLATVTLLLSLLFAIWRFRLFQVDGEKLPSNKEKTS